MTLRLYIDEDALQHALVEALRKRGIDVLTALDAGLIEVADSKHLEFAAGQGRAIYSFNCSDFCQLHSEWMRNQQPHAGIVVAQQQRYSIGEQMRRLLRLATSMSQEEMRNRLEFLGNWG